MSNHKNKKGQAKEKPNNGRLKRFAKKHYKILIVLGGVIISATLSIKDRTLEQLREFNSSVESAKNFSRIEQISRQSNERLEVLDEKMSGTQRAAKARSVHDAPQTAGYLTHIRWMELKEMRASLAEDENLIRLIRRPSKTQMELEDAKRNLDQIMKTLEGEKTSIEVQIRQEGRNSEREILTRYTDQLKSEMERLKSNIFFELERRRIWYQYYYQATSLISYFLIALGFSLSLIGHVIGKDGELPEIKF